MIVKPECRYCEAPVSVFGDVCLPCGAKPDDALTGVLALVAAAKVASDEKADLSEGTY